MRDAGPAEGGEKEGVGQRGVGFGVHCWGY